LVEQRIENPRVGGSIPPPATIFLIRKKPWHMPGLFAFRRIDILLLRHPLLKQG